MLLAVALFGLIGPNGLFFYWVFVEARGFGDLFSNKLALAFMIDAAMAVILIAVYLAKHPIGRIGWRTFVLLSLVGGLGFSLPLYWWLNKREIRAA